MLSTSHPHCDHQAQYKKGKFPIWVILGGVVFQCGSWISNYSNVGRFGYIRRLHCLTIPIWPFLKPQRLNALHTAYRTTLSMDCHSICDSPMSTRAGDARIQIPAATASPHCQADPGLAAAAEDRRYHRAIPLPPATTTPNRN